MTLTSIIPLCAGLLAAVLLIVDLWPEVVRSEQEEND